MKKTLLLIIISCFLKLNGSAISIWEARKNGPNTSCTINGIVLNGAEFGNVRYIWDGTASICAFGSNIASLQKGDSVNLSGTILDYNNLLEISPVTSFTVIASNKPLPDPELIEGHQLAEYTEGALVKLNKVNFTTPQSMFTQNNTYIITTTNGITAELFVKSGNPLVGQPIPTGIVSVTGICSQYNNSYQLLPRGMSDIISTPFYIYESPYITNQSSSGFQLNFRASSNSNAFARYGITPALELGLLSGTTAATFHTVLFSGLPSATKYYVQTFAVNGVDTAKSAVKCFNTNSITSGSIRVLFNRPVDHSKAVPSNNLAVRADFSMADSVAAVINLAQNTLEIAMYSFSTGTAQPIISAINNAANRGVAVRYIYDFGMPNSAVGSMGANVKTFVSPAPLSTNQYNIMHNKFLVIDANGNNSYVIAGSTNFTGGQLNYDANNLVIINDKAIAENYLDEFNEMWGSSGSTPDNLQSRFGYYKRDNASHDFLVNGKRIELYFSPSDNTAEHIRTSVLSANDELYFANLIFTHTELSDAVINRINNGVFVSGIINDTAGSDPSAFLAMKGMLGSNLQLYDFNNQAGILHHKYCIVDQTDLLSDPLVITGSHNFTYTANTLNDENMLIIHSSAIANQFYQEFVSRFNENGGALSVDENEKEKSISVYPNPSNDFITVKFVNPSNTENKILITDMQGRYMQSEIIEKGSGDKTFDISRLTPGIYFLQIEGQQNFNKRFIKL